MRITAKKLQLCRETVRRLDPEDLRQALGGVGIVSSDNRQCTYSKQCPDGGGIIAEPVTIGPIQPIGPAQPIG